MSVPVRVAALLAAFAAVVGLGIYVAFQFIGGYGGTLPTVNYLPAAAHGQVNVLLQADPQNNSADKPDWVSFYVEDPATRQWVHTTLFSVPTSTQVNVTIEGYDGCTPLRNNYWSQVLGTTGGTVTVRQFKKAGVPLDQAVTTSVVNSWSDCNVEHTFSMPGLSLYVPVPSAPASMQNDLCSVSPCTSGPYSLERFSFRTPAQPGSFRWQCFVPCGSGYLDGNGGPMQTLGYMSGFMQVVSS